MSTTNNVSPRANGPANGPVKAPINMALDPDTKKYDHLYAKYEVESDGLKVLPGNAVHPNDKYLENELRVKLPDGTEVYNDKPITIAILGLGKIGTLHFENMMHNPRSQIVAVSEAYAERANYMLYKYRTKGIKVVHPKDVDEVLNDPNVDAVWIGTPTKTHADLISRALKAGKPVCCEKPIGHTYDEIRESYELSAKLNRPLLCAFNRRFDPGLRQIRDRILANEIGQVQVIKTTARDNPPPPESYLAVSGGIFFDCAIHDLDLICFIAREFPSHVSVIATANIDYVKKLNDYDTVAITLKFPSGAIGIIDISRRAVYGYDQRVEVFGSEGMLEHTNVRQTPVVHSNRKGTTVVPIGYNFYTRYGHAYRYELDHFLDVVEGRTAPEVKGHQAMAVAKLITACQESAKTGQVVPVTYEKTSYE